MDVERTIDQLDNLIDNFIDRSEMFVTWSCYLASLVHHNSSMQVRDHEYMAFTKSAKTLLSIKALLEIGNNEDVYILIRSIFESYLAARYLNENVKSEESPLIAMYIQNRFKVAMKMYYINGEGVFNKKGEKVGEAIKIKKQALSKDRNYSKDFYAFISGFAHLDFSRLGYYLNRGQFTIYNESDKILARLFTVFVMTKLFEAIVTIKGEEFYDEAEEDMCYELVESSLLTQRKIFDEYIADMDLFLQREQEGTMRFNANIQKMLRKMNNSLTDNIGDFDKTDLFK